LSLETVLLCPFAFGYLAWLAFHDRNAFLQGSVSTKGLLMAAGPITAVPLLLFAAGARRIPMSMLGVLQYLAPSLQLLIGVWIYHEPFTGQRALGYGVIWSALLVYTLEGSWRAYRGRLVEQ
ncbi:MAG: hypothetical protein WA803_18340, partial [Steroidobacteraceae bacterium]